MSATKFDEKYCDMVQKHLASGLSLPSFAGVIGVSSATVLTWSKTIQCFKDAVEIGKAKHHLFIDQMMVNSIIDDKIQFKPLQFLAKNRHPEHFRDSVEIEVLKGVEKLTDEELINEIEILKKKLLDAES